MALIKRKKSRKQQAADLAVDYLKLKAVSKAVKKTPILKRVPVVLGAGVAAIVATKAVKGRGGEPAVG